MKVTQLLHQITQAECRVEFADDFEGMITVTYFGWPAPGVGGPPDYIRHEHLSYPGGSMEELEVKLIESLERFLNEVRTNTIQKDGLAK